ncbi:MAG: 6,7-dimethyl-8-ribityllumazine synthase, partial [Duncaniella sp.]|nr:6,7-dimethyl-8-ribityllumazine synthase [Duncaniella sp.]
GIPVIYCVLTVLAAQQALDRCGGPAGHKGVEAAETALKMVAFKRRLESL